MRVVEDLPTVLPLPQGPTPIDARCIFAGHQLHGVARGSRQHGQRLVAASALEGAVAPARFGVRLLHQRRPYLHSRSACKGWRAMRVDGEHGVQGDHVPAPVVA